MILKKIILTCWFAAQETFIIIIISVKNICTAYFFAGRFFKVKKEQHLFEI